MSGRRGARGALQEDLISGRGCDRYHALTAIHTGVITDGNKVRLDRARSGFVSNATVDQATLFVDNAKVQLWR